MAFRPNKKFKRDYNQIFREDPLSANLFLLLAEMANKNGQAKIDEGELAELMAARFNDPREYAL